MISMIHHVNQLQHPAAFFHVIRGMDPHPVPFLVRLQREASVTVVR